MGRGKGGDGEMGGCERRGGEKDEHEKIVL